MTQEIRSKEEDIEHLKEMRADYIGQLHKWRARGNDEKADAAFKQCVEINNKLTELGYFDVEVEVVVELPGIEVEG